MLPWEDDRAWFLAAVQDDGTEADGTEADGPDHDGIDDGWEPDLPEEAAAELTWMLTRLGSRIAAGDVPPVDLDVDAGDDGETIEAWDVGAVAVMRLAELSRRRILSGAELEEWAAHANNLLVIAETSLDQHVGGTPGPDGELARMTGLLQRLTTESLETAMRRVHRRRDGRYRLRWSAQDRAVVAHLVGQLDALLGTDDPSMTRLFPPAYGTDVERSREYAALADDELITARRANLAVVTGAINATVLDEDQVLALMRAVNDLRLVIGTRLDVTEDMHPILQARGPDAELWMTYVHLERLLHELLKALRSGL